MASAEFRAYDHNLRRRFWGDLIDAELQAVRRKNFRASLIANPLTGQPLECVPAPKMTLTRREAN